MEAMEGAVLVIEARVGAEGSCCLCDGIGEGKGAIVGAIELDAVPDALLLELLPTAGGEYCVGAEAGLIDALGVIGVAGGSMALVCAAAS